MKKLFILFWCAFFGYLSYTALNSYYNTNPAASYSYGSRGQTVVKIQTRLKSWDYYDGPIDGIYGYKTYSAVKQFQRNNGLYPDGVVGPKTLAAIGISDTSEAGGSGSWSSNHSLLSRAISGEARGEPYVGQVAVGAVIINRTRDPRFPSTIAGVIYQPGAFTAVSDGQIDLEPTSSARNASTDALNGWDPSGGAVFYYNPAKTTNKWIWSRPVIKTIGNHVFCK